jgi:hypothetical protein
MLPAITDGTRGAEPRFCGAGEYAADAACSVSRTHAGGPVRSVRPAMWGSRKPLAAEGELRGTMERRAALVSRPFGMAMERTTSGVDRRRPIRAPVSDVLR